jgi:hypothetical protein
LDEAAIIRNTHTKKNKPSWSFVERKKEMSVPISATLSARKPNTPAMISWPRNLARF